MTEHRGTIAIIGAGSWGTALSIVLGQAGWRINLWARRAKIADAIERTRQNPEYLSDYPLPGSAAATAEMSRAVAGADLIIAAVPSQGMRSVCERLALHIQPDVGVVTAAKGLEQQTGSRMSEVVADCLGPNREGKIAALSGPNLAPEIAAGNASATVAACPDAAFAARVQAALGTPRFRVYTNPDLLGVELGGALKNVIAIGAGVSDGLGFGDNSKAALITRGLAEITRLGVALGARAETFRGLSGIGDLVATCAGAKSRNHFVGCKLAQGRPLHAILAEMAPQIAEGIETTRAALRLAAQVGIEMPITAAVHEVLFEGLAPLEAVKSLMTRAWRDELEE